MGIPTAILGQNDQFPPANPGAGSGFSKQTLAGGRGNWRVTGLARKDTVPESVTKIFEAL
jgi:hypothetical protein